MSEDDPVYEAVLSALRPLSRVEYMEGAGTTDQPVDLACSECGEVGGVRYTGSDVLEGHLDAYHLVHTEVDHHLRCARCGARWTVFKML